MSAAEAYRQCAAAAVDQLLVEHGGPVWDADGFRALLASVRAGFATAAVSSARLVGEILGAADHRRGDAWRPCSRPRTTRSVLDARAHLDRLLHRGWISAAGFDRLPDLARYLRALEHRVEQGPHAARPRPPPHRRPPSARARLPARRRRATPPASVRAMLEELRVSTFAQSVGAKGGVSEPKVRAAIAALA